MQQRLHDGANGVRGAAVVPLPLVSARDTTTHACVVDVVLGGAVVPRVAPNCERRQLGVDVNGTSVGLTCTGRRDGAKHRARVRTALIVCHS